MRYLMTTLVLVAFVAAAPAREPNSDDARRLAARIDEQINVRLVKENVKAAPLVDDAGFYRRASLDLAGKIPAVSDARKFLAEKSPEKRVKAVEALLDSPGYATHMTNQWLELLLPEATSDLQQRFLLINMQRWLRHVFTENKSYDKMAHELLSLPMGNRNDQMDFNRIYDGSGKPSPMNFYIAKKAKPEELAASVARVFMGVRLECAQCHDHPFGKWTREEFWSQAAFFAGFKPAKDQEIFNIRLNEAADRREINIPNSRSDQVAQARFLDGKQPKWKFKTSARETLADWMTSKENPYFSKAIVNRVWHQMFGVGLVDPVDDLVDTNKPSHPELLDLLAKEFAANDFDMKFLLKAIVLSQTYQRASYVDDAKQDMRLFGYVPMKGLTAEQLFDSMSVATGYRDTTPLQQRIFNFGTDRANFMDKFTDQEKKTEYHTSIPQALTMMNNKLINEATNPDKGQVLGAVVSSSFMKTPEKIETLVLAALSRKPTKEEAAKFLAYVKAKGAKNEKKALSDVYWALLNSTEFKFNH
jgi:hypothetical protein